MRGQVMDGLRRILVCVASLSPAYSFGQATTGTVSAPASVIVDAAMGVAKSRSGDDLGTLQNIFQDANAPADGQPDLGEIVADLKMKRIRILQGDGYCSLDARGQNFVSSPDLLGWQIDWATRYGLTPHVAVASTMPSYFTQFGPAETWDKPTDMGIMDKYRSYALQLVRYILGRTRQGGVHSVVFEVSNELDIADSQPVGFFQYNPTNLDPSTSDGAAQITTLTSHWSLLPLGTWGRFLWWIDPATYELGQWPPCCQSIPPYPYGDDPRRVARGISPVQKIYGDAIETVRKEFPDMRVEFAGPALSGHSFQWLYYQPWLSSDAQTVVPTLEETFLEQMLDPNSEGGQFNSRLDYASFHYYGDFRHGASSLPQAQATTTLQFETNRLLTTASNLTQARHDVTLPEIKLFVSEWGPSIDESPTSINSSNAGAAWAAAFLTEAVTDQVAMGSYLIIDDAVGTTDGSLPVGRPGQASLTHRINNSDGTSVYVPKPPANVFKMFAMMTGARRALTLTDASGKLGAFAASDATSAGVVVFNYASDFSDTTVPFTVELDNLPFNGSVTVERYLVDANTSNLAATGTDPHLQQVEQPPLALQVQNGQLTLPLRPLGLGVTFWRIYSN